MTEMELILGKALQNNRQTLLLGAAGTAKTATVHKVASNLGLPVFVLSLAGIPPEDIAGLIRPDSDTNPTSYKYLVPSWFKEREGKPFVLFLDEINQASIETLHALFYVVNDRTVAGLANKEMRIVAAGNTEDENEFLTPLPKPLSDRFVYKLNWIPDLLASLDYLEKKYESAPKAAEIPSLINSIRCVNECTARHAEHAIMMAIDGLLNDERGRYLIGSAYDMWLKNIPKERKIDDMRIDYLRNVKHRLESPFVVINGVMTSTSAEERQHLISSLTDDEKEMMGV